MLETAKINYPFIAIPKVLRYLSFIDDDGNQKPLSPNHVWYLTYCAELEECYKSLKTQAKELRICKDTVIKLRRELEKPMVEIGVPLIRTSKFFDNHDNERTLIEVFPSQKELSEYHDKIYDKETGQAYRNRWNELAVGWKKFKKSLGGGRLDRQGGVDGVDTNYTNWKEHKSSTKTTTKKGNHRKGSPSQESSSSSDSLEKAELLREIPLNGSTKKRAMKYPIEDIEVAIHNTNLKNPDDYGAYFFDQLKHAKEYGKTKKTTDSKQYVESVLRKYCSEHGEIQVSLLEDHLIISKGDLCGMFEYGSPTFVEDMNEVLNVFGVSERL